MNIADLQINDYVNIYKFSGDFDIERQRKRFPAIITGIHADEESVMSIPFVELKYEEDNTLCRCSRPVSTVEPIKITSDILLNNGFILNNGRYILKLSDMISIEYDMRDFKLTKYWKSKDEWTNADIIEIMNRCHLIQYIHELQHAFNLFNIQLNIKI